VNAESLRALIDAGDHEGVVKLFATATEEERKGVAEQVLVRFKAEVRHRFVQTAPGTLSYNKELSAAECAVLAACSFSQIKKLGSKVIVRGKDLLAIFSARRPAWLDDWAEVAIEANPLNWAVIRQFMRLGLCTRPQSDNYILGMIAGLLDHNPLRERRQDATLLEALQEDPDLLEYEVWRLFEIEGTGQHSLAARDKYLTRKSDRSWGHALVELSHQKKLSRTRLLDASLDALARDFIQFRAGWYSRFHDLLEPTPDEQQARADRYLGLLGSSIPTTVAWASKIVEQIDKRQPLPTATLIDALRPAIEARAKGTVSTALKFLARIAKRNAQQHAAACLAATAALSHESSDVQGIALDLLEEFGGSSDEQLLQSVTRYGGSISPSVRPRLETLIAGAKKSIGDSPVKHAEPRKPRGDLAKRISAIPPDLAELAGLPRAAASLKTGQLDLAALTFAGTEFPRLDAAVQITPVSTVNELVDLAAQVIEDAGKIDDVERVLDGVSRLCDQRPADFAKLTGPLAKRVIDLSRRSGGPFAGLGPVEDILGVLRAWLNGRLHEPVSSSKRSDHEFFAYDVEGKNSEFYVHQAYDAVKSLSLRALEVARRAADGKARPLLSAPTHAGGWIDPRVLVRRAAEMNRHKEELSTIDIVFALLRVAPDHRGEALAMAEPLPGEQGTAIRYALGGKAARIGPTAALWVAAARCRSPWANDDRVEKSHPELGPDAGTAASYTIRARRRDKWLYLRIEREPKKSKSPDATLPTVRFHVDLGSEVMFGQTGGGAIAWLQTIWPLARESFFAQGVEAVASNLDWWEARWGNRSYFEPLLDADVPLRPMALLLLTLGLAAREPGEQGLATDALIAAILDGRLDGHKLGSMMARLWPDGLIKMARWAKALADAARVSPLHAQAVFDTIERALQGDAEKLPRDCHALFDLFKELGVETGSRVQAEPTRKLLSAIKASGKTGKAAAELLALVEKPDHKRNTAIMQTVLEHRLLRAERWAMRRTEK
jgi:hypothetical protein